MKRLEIKSEAFFKNYMTSKGAEITYDDFGYMNPPAFPDGRVPVVNLMLEHMGGYNFLYEKHVNHYHCYGWNWPLWMCEEVEINYED